MEREFSSQSDDVITDEQLAEMMRCGSMGVGFEAVGACAGRSYPISLALVTSV